MQRISIRPSKRREASAARRDAAIDRWCNRAGQLSQILLLCLGIFGYFYTVLPLYQKALLDEDIAQKTIELKSKTAELTEKTGQVTELSAQIALRSQQLSAAQSSASLAKAEKELAVSKADIASLDAQVTYIKLRREYYGAVLSHLRGCAGFNLIFTGPVAGGLERCLARVPEQVQGLFAQLNPDEFPRLQAELAKLSASYKDEYAGIVKAMDEKVAPLNVELKPLKEAYATSNTLKVNSKEWLEATGNYINRGFKIEAEIRAHQKEASDKYAKLLEKVAAELWEAVRATKKAS